MYSIFALSFCRDHIQIGRILDNSEQVSYSLPVFAMFIQPESGITGYNLLRL